MLAWQEAAKAARRRAQGRRLEQAFLEGADPSSDPLPSSGHAPSAEEAAAAAERQYADELAAELQVRAGVLHDAPVHFA